MPNIVDGMLEIPGYAYKVTAFDSYNEAAQAREIALAENDDYEAGAIEAYMGKYIVRLWVAQANMYL